MIIRFPKSKLTPKVYDYLKDSLYYKIISYVTNWKNIKESKDLQKWIKPQVLNPSTKILELANTIATKIDSDEQVIEVLRYVRNHLTYISDKVNWSTGEYWSTTDETISKWTGDCEDGANLIHVLCRLKGVPANRLMLCVGSVEGGNHCWCAYKPNELPFDIVFLDWCYWYNNDTVSSRTKYNINIDTIREYDNTETLIKSKYYTLMFWYNEEYSSDRILYDFSKVYNE